MFFCSPKQLHFREYLLPDGVSSIVPSGVNNHASNYSKCYPLSIVRRILYECYHIYDLCANIDHIIASGFVRTINRMKSLGYPMPPPLMLERKFTFDITDDVSLGNFFIADFCGDCFFNQ